MDAYIDERMDGWMGRWMNRCMDGCIYRYTKTGIYYHDMTITHSLLLGPLIRRSTCRYMSNSRQSNVTLLNSRN